MKRSLSSVFLFASWLVFVACSSEPPNSGPDATGGTGGVPGTGGEGTGGSSDTGGTSSGGTASGGTASGGATTGGAAGEGGMDGSGGEEAGTGGDNGDPGSGGSPPSTDSEGCGTATQQQRAAWVQSTLNRPGGGGRAYSTWLPTGYDADRAYPVILLLHGCGSGTNNLPMEQQTGADAIVIRGTGSRNDGCWHDTPDGAAMTDMPYIDAMLEDVQERFCVDTSRLFAVGYSSGSWVTNQLACIRSNVFRGLASVTGGEPALGQCGGPVARMFVHDAGDMTNLPQWSRSARDRMLSTNECDSPPASDPVQPSPCVKYRGCLPDYPVIWCETNGQGHGRQDNFAAPAFWNFFQSLD